MPLAKTISKNYWALPQKDCEAFEIVCNLHNLKRHLNYSFSHCFKVVWGTWTFAKNVGSLPILVMDYLAHDEHFSFHV